MNSPEEELEVQGNSEIKLYTVKDLQRIFHIGKNKAYELINIKGFPYIKIVRNILIPDDKLRKWISENTK